MRDWETQRAESLQAAKASILEAGGQLSNKLLEDHKREAEAAKKDAEAMLRKTSETLLEQVMNVTKSVSELKGQTSETSEKMATVWRALTTPAGAGYLAEVGLENSLKNLGLEQGRDYVMQYAMNSEDAGSLRPDAAIFLPQDMVMVIDSKASKFLIEIAQAQQNGDEAEALGSLKKTMNDHLKALISKNYSAAIQAAYKESGRAEKLRTVLNVMYLPSDNAVAHIKRADPEFLQKTEKAGIILAGPASLSGLLSLARLNIGMARQAANQDAIVEGVQELMDNIITALSYADKVGKGLKSAADNFDQFARSVNRRLLPKARQLGTLGVKPGKSKELPGRIVSYEVRLSDDVLTIEGESEAIEDTGVIEAFPKKVSA
jgi:DNA recombination protein RmuC